MSRVTEVGMEEGKGSRSGARSDEPEARSEVRWSARRKEGVVMRLLRGESRAFQRNDLQKEVRLGRVIQRRMSRMQKFSSEGRAAVIRADALGSKEGKAVIAAGDAWTEFAFERLREPAGGDFQRARELSDLIIKAGLAQQRAYRALGEPLPREWQF